MDVIKGREVLLPSGAKLYVNPSNYEESEECLGTLLDAVKGLPMDTDNDQLLKIASEAGISQAFRNPPFKAAVWKCLAKCLYLPKNGIAPMKVDRTLFDGAGNREDLPEVIYECVIENVGPFLKGLLQASRRLAQTIRSTQKSLQEPLETLSSSTSR